MKEPKAFSIGLQNKLTTLKNRREKTKLGRIDFDSKLILAPMAGICNAPYRLLMEDLGAGFTVSELISCHGINYKNSKTLEMLKLHPLEKNVGIQLFGEDPHAMAEAALIAESFGPKLIDINMGCPVKKVVGKGAGSALLRDSKSLGPYISTIKKGLKVPLTIKIRMGWDADEINADEIIKVAQDNGVEFVAIHGRTRAQQYTGKADWSYLEKMAQISALPVIGNGDLHTPYLVKERYQNTNCDALMIARGALRNPFIFLESFTETNDGIKFDGPDYFEVIKRLYEYTIETFPDERGALVQIRKLVVWFAAGFPYTAKFRGQMFATNTLEEAMTLAEDYFLNLGLSGKQIDLTETFMTSGHG
ncbi:MAG: tRNA dihydrouridine synthase DusB [Bacteriovoracaceae bacterium]